MAVTSEQVRVSYAGDAVSTVFSVPWYFTDADDLLVILRDAAGGETTLVRNVDYTVSGVAVPAGGSITMTVAPIVGVALFIIHDPALLQGLTLVPGTAIPLPAFEQTLDQLVHMSQRTRDLVMERVMLREETETDGDGAYDARANRITNLADPESGQDAATQAYVLSQTIVSSVPPANSLTDAMWNAASPLNSSKVTGIDATQMANEVDPFPAGVLNPSVTLHGAFHRLQYQLLNFLNWADAGARAHAYEDIPTSNLPAVVAAAVAAAAPLGQGILPNGSLLVAQRFPSLTATGTIATGIDAYVCDRWFILPTGGTVTWHRTSTGLHTGSRSPMGLRLVGAAGITNLVLGIRLGRDVTRALGALLANKNVTFGCKVRHSGSTGSTTPNFLVRSTSNAGADSTATKFATANMTTRLTQAFPGALGAGAEVAFTHTFDLGAMVDSQNGIELLVDLLAVSAATHELTVSDLFLAFGDLTSALLPDDFDTELARVRPWYRKTFGYDVQPAQNAGFTGTLASAGAPGGTPIAFDFRLDPPMKRAAGTLVTYNPGAAANTPRNHNGDNGTLTANDVGDSGVLIRFETVGANNRSWHIHATLDCEWFD